MGLKASLLEMRMGHILCRPHTTSKASTIKASYYEYYIGRILLVGLILTVFRGSSICEHSCRIRIHMLTANIRGRGRLRQPLRRRSCHCFASLHFPATSFLLAVADGYFDAIRARCMLSRARAGEIIERARNGRGRSLHQQRKGGSGRGRRTLRRRSLRRWRKR